MKILVGSKAAKIHFPEWREGNDTDYISTNMIFDVGGHRVECHFEPEFYRAFGLLARNMCTVRLGDMCEFVAEPNFLYTLKVSHSFWDIHWQKTIADIRHFKRLGCVLVPELYDVFYPTWERVHGKKQVNLNVPNESFFTHYVQRQVDHDELHEIFKTGPVPKYKVLKKDPSKAMISREMFFAQSYEDQLNTVREEMCVLAAERYLMAGLTTSPGVAVRSALKLLITSASKGWFPLFIVDNWDKVLESKLPPQLKGMK